MPQLPTVESAPANWRARVGVPILDVPRRLSRCLSRPKPAVRLDGPRLANNREPGARLLRLLPTRVLCPDVRLRLDAANRRGGFHRRHERLWGVRARLASDDPQDLACPIERKGASRC